MTTRQRFRDANCRIMNKQIVCGATGMRGLHALQSATVVARCATVRSSNRRQKAARNASLTARPKLHLATQIDVENPNALMVYGQSGLKKSAQSRAVPVFRSHG